MEDSSSYSTKEKFSKNVEYYRNLLKKTKFGILLKYFTNFNKTNLLETGLFSGVEGT